MGKLTLAPTLKSVTSIGATSCSICANSFVTSSSLRASEPKARALPPSASICATRGRELVRVAAEDQRRADIALAREAPRDRAAGRVARAHHQELPFFSLMRPPPFYFALMPPRQPVSRGASRIAVDQAASPAPARCRRTTSRDICRFRHGDAAQPGAEEGAELVEQQRSPPGWRDSARRTACRPARGGRHGGEPGEAEHDGEDVEGEPVFGATRKQRITTVRDIEPEQQVSSSGARQPAAAEAARDVGDADEPERGGRPRREAAEATSPGRCVTRKAMWKPQVKKPSRHR